MTEKSNALAAADALEAEYLAVANGTKNPGKMDLEPMVRAVQVIRKLERASQPGGGEAGLREALSDYETMRDTVGGCTDGGCLVKKPIGMHTNGGCKCHKDAIKATRMMWAGSKLFDAARAALAGRS